MREPRYQNYTQLHFYGNAYDVAWAVAIGLHNAELRAMEGRPDEECDSYPGEHVLLSDFNYTNQKMGCFLHKGFASVDFVGITVSELNCMHVNCS